MQSSSYDELMDKKTNEFFEEILKSKMVKNKIK